MYSKTFDVGDLPVLTFGNCVLKTGVTNKWPLKLYVRFYVFFLFLNPKHDFLRFLVVARVFSNAGSDVIATVPLYSSNSSGMR